MIVLQGPNSDTISNNPDFSSILQVGSKLFGVTHYEAPNPGVAYVSEYLQNPKTGAIKVIFAFLPLNCNADFTPTMVAMMRWQYAIPVT